MGDLTLPLIGLTTLIGYYFSNQEVQESKVEPKKGVEKFEKTNGKNIYDSNMVDNANDEVLKRMYANYKDSQNPAETSIIPPYFNAYSIGNKMALDTVNNVNVFTSSSKEQSEINDINRIKNPIKSTSVPLEKRPMFQSETKKFDKEDIDKKYVELGFNKQR